MDLIQVKGEALGSTKMALGVAVGRRCRVRCMVRDFSLEEALARLAECRTEHEVVAWAANYQGHGSAELYEAIREKFAALRRGDEETPKD